MKDEDTSFALSLIGKPWVSGASGPDSFNCWGLVRYCFAERKGIILPQFSGIDEVSLSKLVRTAESQALEHWEEILKPEHFAVVGMSTNLRISHVGLWLDIDGGGIFHSSSGSGVVFQSIQTIRQNGIQLFKFYKKRS